VSEAFHPLFIEQMMVIRQRFPQGMQQNLSILFSLSSLPQIVADAVNYENTFHPLFIEQSHTAYEYCLGIDTFHPLFIEQEKHTHKKIRQSMRIFPSSFH
jgi:hypothetical protein